MPSADYRNQTLGLPSPKMRRDDYDLLMCFRIFKGLTKIRLSDLYKISETSTRGPGTKIVLPRYKTNCWRQAFAVRTAHAFKKFAFPCPKCDINQKLQEKIEQWKISWISWAVADSTGTGTCLMDGNEIVLIMNFVLFMYVVFVINVIWIMWYSNV